MAAGLQSWRTGPTRDAIEAFATAVATEGGTDFVPPDERIAVFDNDGTLWTEKPMPTQLHFIVEQWKRMAAADPSLADEQPYKAVLAGDFGWLGATIDAHHAGDDAGVKVLIGAVIKASAGMTVDAYAEAVAAFYADARHLVLERPYSEVVYQPMVELLRYLEGRGFTCYIVSGGERDFMRPMTTDYYGIPPERVVGTTLGLSWVEGPDGGHVTYSPSLAFFDDGPEKPIRIWSRIGRRPILAAGNSNGDIPMLRYAEGHPRSLSLLVHHDDDTGRGDAPYDEGAEDALKTAAARGWPVVSVKDDWSAVFPDPAA
jgi:phosphoglycolate phosphatase-like HAD superfamily hydrolase